MIILVRVRLVMIHLVVFQKDYWLLMLKKLALHVWNAQEHSMCLLLITFGTCSL